MKLVFGLMGKFGDRVAADDVKSQIEDSVCFRHEGTAYETVLAAATEAVAHILDRFETPRAYGIPEAGQNFIAKESRGVDGEDVCSPGPSNVNTSCPGGQQLSHELEVAIQDSVAEATAREGADVQEALLHSKIDAVQRQLLVVLRLTKRNSYVLDALLRDHGLQEVQAQVEDAGCEILPDWANGAVLLAPLTEVQVLEAKVELRPHHIVVAQQYQALVEQALKTIPKRQGRPGVQLADADHLTGAAVTMETNIAGSSRTEPLSHMYCRVDEMWDGLWHVERTFVHCPLPHSVSSRSMHSEPWGGATDGRPLKLPRLLGNRA